MLSPSDNESGAGVPFAVLERVATPIARECRVANESGHLSLLSLFSFFLFAAEVATPIASECGLAIRIAREGHSHCSLSLTMKMAISRCSLFSFFLFAAEVTTPIVAHTRMHARAHTHTDTHTHTHVNTHREAQTQTQT